MKITFALLILLTFSFCSNKNSARESDLVVKSVLKGVFDARDGTGNENILVEVKLINNSSSVKKFITMTCTTFTHLIFNSKNVEPFVNNCAGNFPTTITLNPKQEFSYVVMLKIIPPFPNQLKIGWILLDYENTRNTEDYFIVKEKSREKLENIIWSEPLIIGCCGGNTYEIR
jgi:hypothetical protein